MLSDGELSRRIELVCFMADLIGEADRGRGACLTARFSVGPGANRACRAGLFELERFNWPFSPASAATGLFSAIIAFGSLFISGASDLSTVGGAGVSRGTSWVGFLLGSGPRGFSNSACRVGTASRALSTVWGGLGRRSPTLGLSFVTVDSLWTIAVGCWVVWLG